MPKKLLTARCDLCAHWDKDGCTKGHTPRFYMPRSYLDTNWGFKRKCRDHVLMLTDLFGRTTVVPTWGDRHA